MFTETKVINYYKERKMDMFERAMNKLDEAEETLHFIGNFERLKEKFEDVKRFKKNKDFLYVNRFKRRFYYFRDKDNHPRITVCVIQDPKSKIYCRGLSLCSFMDATEKEFGRDMAEDRAIQAFKTQKHSEKMTRVETDKIVGSILKFGNELISAYKSVYDTLLTEFETKLFTPKPESQNYN